MASLWPPRESTDDESDHESIDTQDIFFPRPFVCLPVCLSVCLGLGLRPTIRTPQSSSSSVCFSSCASFSSASPSLFLCLFFLPFVLGLLLPCTAVSEHVQRRNELLWLAATVGCYFSLAVQHVFGVDVCIPPAAASRSTTVRADSHAEERQPLMKTVAL